MTLVEPPTVDARVGAALSITGSGFDVARGYLSHCAATSARARSATALECVSPGLAGADAAAAAAVAGAATGRRRGSRAVRARTVDDPDAAGASDDDSGENSAELNFLASASMATSSLRLRQVTSDQIKLSVHAPLALASAAGRRCPLCEHGALACRFVAVDGGAVFALEVKYVSARTAVCAAPEALTPSWSAALLEAAYYVEFSNDNTAFSRVPSCGDAASGDAASDGDAATPFVFTVSPPPSASSFSPEATALEGGATISVRGSDFAPGAAPLLVLARGRRRGRRRLARASGRRRVVRLVVRRAGGGSAVTWAGSVSSLALFELVVSRSFQFIYFCRRECG